MAIGAILPIYSLLLVLNSQDGFAEERGDWISREGPKTFIMFNISRTEEFCGLNTDFVEFDELVADYTDIINKAVALMNSKGGGAVLLDIGTYIVKTPIVMLSQTCIIGQGRGRTVIKLQDKAPKFTNSGLLRAEGAEHIVLREFRIDGNRANQDASDEAQNKKRAGIHFTLVNFVRLLNVSISQNFGNGLNIRGKGNSSFSSYMDFHQIHSWDNAGDGFSITQVGWTSIIAGTAGRNGRHGVAISNAKHVWLENMGIRKTRGEKACGVAIRDDTHDVLIEGVRIKDATLAGVCAQNSSSIRAKDGKITNAPADQTAVCYHVRKITGFRIDENTCVLNDGLLLDTDGSVSFPTAVPLPLRTTLV